MILLAQSSEVFALLARFLGIGDRVELLVSLFDAVDDLHRIRLVWRRNLDGLEAALERTVFLDRFAIFTGRGCADALDLAARQGRLEDIGGIKGALGRPGTDQRV